MRNYIAFVIAAGLTVAAAQVPSVKPPEFFKSTDGAELFKFYCANCHGLDAKGRAATPAMRTPSTDLTRLAITNGGRFPRERVLTTIKHGAPATPAHGPKDMPVWGTIFRSMERDDTAVEIRIENLVNYIESLQESGSRLCEQ